MNAIENKEDLAEIAGMMREIMVAIAQGLTNGIRQMSDEELIKEIEKHISEEK